jgi:lysozyme family protein
MMALLTSSGSPRERWIKALLPAAVIVMVYLALINLGRSREIRALRKDLADEQKRAVSEDTLVTVHTQQLAALKQRDELTQQIEDARRSIDASLQQFGGGSATERMVQIGRLCRELSIRLLRQKPVTDMQVSKVRESSLQTLRKLVRPDAVSYRQLDLVGHYCDVETLLRRLPETVDGVVPLAIESLEAETNEDGSPPSSGERHWRLSLLM